MVDRMVATQMFTELARNRIYIASAFPRAAHQQVTFFDKVVKASSRKPVSDGSPVCSSRLSFSVGTTSNLSRLDRPGAGTHTLTPEFKKSCLQPAPAYDFLPHFTLNP